MPFFPIFYITDTLYNTFFITYNNATQLRNFHPLATLICIAKPVTLKHERNRGSKQISQKTHSDNIQITIADILELIELHPYLAEKEGIAMEDPEKYIQIYTEEEFKE